MDRCEVCGTSSKDLDYGTTTQGDVLGFCEKCVAQRKTECIDIVSNVLGGWDNLPSFMKQLYTANNKAVPMGRLWEVREKGEGI